MTARSPSRSTTSSRPANSWPIGILRPTSWSDKRAFIEDVREAHLHDKIKSLGLPLLILHSPTDDTVGIENASEIFSSARHPRSFVSLEGSDHLLTARGQAHRAGRIIGAWADAYLDMQR